MTTLEVGEVPKRSSDYPSLLKKIHDAPDPLYFLGNYHKNIFENTLAVVGSRAVTMYGEWVVQNIVKEVARCGITIVSGFMYGVDALAHQAALDVDGKTIAVMAGSIDNVCPSYQQGLYDEIVLRGLVVSEFKEQGIGGKWMFVKRNRIVAGLSHAVLVVEAAESSGSLITANYAKQYGREILTVPGNLNSRNSFGNNQLLREGAKLVSFVDDILQVYYGDTDNYRHKIDNALNKRLLIPDEETVLQRMLEVLSTEPLSADELSLKLHITISEVLKCLTGLNVFGGVKEKGGRYYVN